MFIKDVSTRKKDQFSKILKDFEREIEFLKESFSFNKSYYDAPEAVVKESDNIMDHLEFLRKDCERLMKSALNTMLKNLAFDHVVEPSEEICQKIASVTDYQTVVSLHEVNINDNLSPAEKRKKIERIIAKAPKA